MNKPDFVFSCSKCGHLLFTTKKVEKVENLLKLDCPNCGEEPNENWILVRDGNYGKEYGDKK